MAHSKTEPKNELVLFHKKGRLAFMTFNRPQKLNALNIPLIEEFKEVLAYIDEDEEISVVIITGAGRAFSAGADLDMLLSYESIAAFRRELKEQWQKAFNAMEDMEKLFIAALNGLTLGGACELAIACDLRVAVEGISMALMEIKHGMIPDVGSINRLPNLVGAAMAKELILSGDAITSEEAYRIGLVNKVFPAEHFLDEVEKYASKFTGNAKTAVGLGKLAINKGLHQDVKSGLVDAMMIQSILLKDEGYLEATRKHQEKKGKS
jgi:enoyl-CoA hydratase